MNDPARILKDDHREVEKLLRQLADTDEGRERHDLTTELTTKLAAHMKMEESIIYPRVAQRVGAEDEEEARIEHALVREGLEKLAGMVDVPGFGAVVEMLSGGIHHHVKEEEAELLPALKDSMERDEWQALGTALVVAKEAAGLPVPTAPARRKSTKRRQKATAK